MKSVVVSAENKHVDIADYLKGFSIFTISLMHLLLILPFVPGSIAKMSSIGGSGVHVFFLCSGMGLYFSYLNKETTFVQFLAKRFSKIYIPYIFVVLVSFFLPWMYEDADRFAALLSHVFLYKMFVPRYEQSFGTQLWFVSTIIQLYLLFIPMCVIKKNIKNKYVFGALFLAISVIWWCICLALKVTEVRVWNSFCLQYIWEFALGMVLAQELYDGQKYELKWYVLLLVAITGIGIQTAMAMLSDVLKVFNDIPALVGYTSLALLVSYIPIFKKSFAWMSKFSYEYYLVHVSVFVTMVYLFKPGSFSASAGVGVLSVMLSIALSYLFGHCIAFVRKRVK